MSKMHEEYLQGHKGLYTMAAGKDNKGELDIQRSIRDKDDVGDDDDGSGGGDEYPRICNRPRRFCAALKFHTASINRAAHFHAKRQG